MVPDPSLLSTEEFTAYVGWVNRWVRDAWERFEWPELCPVEERWYRPFWDVGATYQIGDEVYFEGADAYFRCIAGDVVAEVPDASPFWEQCGVDEADALDRYIGLDQPGETAIGTMLDLYRANPKQYPRSGTLEFGISADGVQVPACLGNSAWIRFRKRPSKFTANRWSNATSYGAGQSVYYPSTGECYVTVSAPPVGTVPTNETYWAAIPFPYVLSTFVELAAYAEALRDDGQFDKGRATKDDAEDLLLTEWHKSESQQRQTRKFLVHTR